MDAKALPGHTAGAGQQAPVVGRLQAGRVRRAGCPITIWTASAATSERRVLEGPRRRGVAFRSQRKSAALGATRRAALTAVGPDLGSMDRSHLRWRAPRSGPPSSPRPRRRSDARRVLCHPRRSDSGLRRATLHLEIYPNVWYYKVVYTSPALMRSRPMT